MTLLATTPGKLEIDFRGGANADKLSGTTVSGAGAVDTAAGLDKGASFIAAADTDDAYGHFGDALTLPIDKILSAEFVCKFVNWDAQAFALIGLASAANADPDLIAQSVWFKVDGALALFVESDDGTLENSNIATGLTVPASEWTRFRIDFKTGIQTKSPPSTSLGGKSAIRFQAATVAGSGVKGLDRHLDLQTEIDMSNYAGGLQVFLGTTGGREMYCSRICVEYENDG